MWAISVKLNNLQIVYGVTSLQKWQAINILDDVLR